MHVESGNHKMISVLLMEIIVASIVALLLHAWFFYWYASRNRKIDLHIQPQVFRWQVRVVLLLLGAVVVALLFQPSTLFGIFGLQSRFNWLQTSMLSFFVLPFLLFAVLLGLVVWAGGFVVVWAVLGLVFPLPLLSTNSQVQVLYFGYVFLSMFPILASLFLSSRYAVDTLILRLRDAGYADAADNLERGGRIGIGSFLWAIALPAALCTRWIRRGTKAGEMKITLSITPRSHLAIERYVMVELPEI